MLRLVTYNIQFSRGKDGRFDLSRIAAAVRGADVIALQEVERFWPRSGMQDQPAELARLLHAYYWVYGPGFDVHGGDGCGPDNRRRQFGVMLLSRTPIVQSRSLVLPKTHYPDAFNMYQGAVHGVIDSPIGPLGVWNVHLGYLDTPERIAQLAYLRTLSERDQAERGAWSGAGDIRGDDWSAGTRPPPAPVESVWLGDFNSEPGSPEYACLLAAGLHDAAAGSEAEQAYTHEMDREDPPRRRRLDYCFVSAGLRDHVRGYRVDHSAVGSDHQPVWVHLDALTA